MRLNALAFRNRLRQLEGRPAAGFFARLRGRATDTETLQDIQLYARAAIVFAGITAEAALNTYGLIRFGEQEFEQHFAYCGPVKRLRRLAKFGAGRDLSATDDIVVALERIIGIRNQVIHVRSEESRFDEQGVVRPVGTQRRYNWASEVDGVFAEMDRFLGLFASIDPETRSFLAWHIPAFP